MSKRLASDIKLWHSVREAHEKLAALPRAAPKDSGDLTKDEAVMASWISLDGLRVAWKTLDDEVYKGKVGHIELEKTAENPLAALMIFVSQGVYPPPELLAGLLAAWDEYISGDKTIEQAFVGPSVQRAGPYRKRTKKAWAERNAIGMYRRLLEHGMNQQRAAERAQRVFPDCKLSVESLSRVARRQEVDPFDDLSALFQVMAARPRLRADKKRRI